MPDRDFAVPGTDKTKFLGVDPERQTTRSTPANFPFAGGESAGSVVLPDPTPGSGVSAFSTGVVNVRLQGAKGDGVTDDTIAIAAASLIAKDFAGPGKGGVLYFPPGEYITRQQTVYHAVEWKGEGEACTVIKLKNGSNEDLVRSDGFAANLNTNNDGPGLFSFSNLTLDANRANQTSMSRCLAVFGWGYRISNVTMRNGHTWGMYSEWKAGGAVSMEALLNQFRVIDYGGTNGSGGGIDWNGPHDSAFVHGIVKTLDSTIRPYQAKYDTAGPVNVGTAPTLALTGSTPFTFTTTEAADTTLFPESGGHFLVPVITTSEAGINFDVVRYTACSTTGTATTFTGCTSGTVYNVSTVTNVGIIRPEWGIRINDSKTALTGEATLNLSNVHIWGRHHIGIGSSVFKTGKGASSSTPIIATGCQSEGAFIANVNMTTASRWEGGAVYGTLGQAGNEHEAGIVFGSAYVGCNNALVDTKIFNIGNNTSPGLGGRAVIMWNGADNEVRASGSTSNLQTAPHGYVARGSGSNRNRYNINLQTANMSVIREGYGGNTDLSKIPQLQTGFTLGGVGVFGHARFTSSNAAPSHAGTAGDYHFRTDTPSTANQRIYICTTSNSATTGAWTALI